MPMYSYTSGSETIERCYRMGKAPKTVRVAGRRYQRDVAADHRRFKNTPGNWPMLSDACGCDPSQRAEYMREAKRLGVPTYVNNDGQVEFRSASHRKSFLKAFRYYDRNAGYGDPTPEAR